MQTCHPRENETLGKVKAETAVLWLFPTIAWGQEEGKDGEKIGAAQKNGICVLVVVAKSRANRDDGGAPPGKEASC